MNAIDIGDYVHHEPTGEDWIVALVDGDRLYWCDYPFGGSAALADCTLIEKATDERRNELLNRLAVTVSDALPVLKARERLVAIRKALRELDGRKG